MGEYAITPYVSAVFEGQEIGRVGHGVIVYILDSLVWIFHHV